VLPWRLALRSGAFRATVARLGDARDALPPSAIISARRPVPPRFSFSPPPRPRGSHSLAPHGDLPDRSTPASAGISFSRRRIRAPSPVYPRVRADLLVKELRFNSDRGLPPRPRGSRRGFGRRLGARGSTPASAGISPGAARKLVPALVYPRVRGDLRCGALTKGGVGGLPPHPRGSRWEADNATVTDGSTPASAGISQPLARCGSPQSVYPASAGISALHQCWTPTTRVYPRIRGDLPGVSVPGSSTRGLPPHPRGSHASSQLPSRPARSTPASAGISAPRRPSSPPPPVYPRIRGDLRALRSPELTRRGLPPHPRGSPVRPLDDERAAGSTPASAGISAPGRGAVRAPPVYPRIRGDLQLVVQAFLTSGGLPPHPRGSHRPGERRPAAGGSTPASAGISRAVPSLASSGAVYPRIRGDLCDVVRHPYPSAGLPPHPRGSPLRRRPASARNRSTPASAGISRDPCRRITRRTVYPRIRGVNFPGWSGHLTNPE
jgi:hypothetical protein